MPFHDLRIAVRHLLKSPGFTATAVLMLALGIGATTAIFSIVEGVLLRPLPFPHSERLVQLSDILQGADVGGNSEAGVTAPDIQALHARHAQLRESGRLYANGLRTLGHRRSGAGDCSPTCPAGSFRRCKSRLSWAASSPSRKTSKREQVAVLSYSLWQNRLHGDPQVLGTKILLDRKPYVVIGVMPRNFEFPLVPGHLNSSGAVGSDELHASRNSERAAPPAGTSAWSDASSRELPRRRRESDAQRVAAGDDAQLSAVHGESAHPRRGALAARGNGGASASAGAHHCSWRLSWCC